MNSIVNIEINGKLLILKTQGYLNKDLGEEILEVSKTNIGQGVDKVIINLEHSNIDQQHRRVDFDRVNRRAARGRRQPCVLLSNTHCRENVQYNGAYKILRNL